MVQPIAGPCKTWDERRVIPVSLVKVSRVLPKRETLRPPMSGRPQCCTDVQLAQNIRRSNPWGRLCHYVDHPALPAIDCEVIQVQRRRPTSAVTIDLKVGFQVTMCPSQSECRRHSLIDLSFNAIKPHRLVGDIAYGVARIADLDMMPVQSE